MTHHAGATLLESRRAAEEYASVQESFGPVAGRAEYMTSQSPAWDGERRQGSAPVRGAPADQPVGPKTCQ
eukprot:12872979-Heterocapsa_arctica.AAC.1